MKTLDLVREYFPEVSQEEANHILWEHTGSPEFFDPKAGAVETFRAQLREYAESSVGHNGYSAGST